MDFSFFETQLNEKKENLNDKIKKILEEIKRIEGIETDIFNLKEYVKQLSITSCEFTKEIIRNINGKTKNACEILEEEMSKESISCLDQIRFNEEKLQKEKNKENLLKEKTKLEQELNFTLFQLQNIPKEKNAEEKKAFSDEKKNLEDRLGKRNSTSSFEDSLPKRSFNTPVFYAVQTSFNFPPPPLYLKQEVNLNFPDLKRLSDIAKLYFAASTLKKQYTDGHIKKVSNHIESFFDRILFYFVNNGCKKFFSNEPHNRPIKFNTSLLNQVEEYLEVFYEGTFSSEKDAIFCCCKFITEIYYLYEVQTPEKYIIKTSQFLEFAVKSYNCFFHKNISFDDAPFYDLCENFASQILSKIK
jgi:hypothetical protein